ncbi:hypothetical protein QYE76_066932 [Lolium multiflorum]|uniref:Transposase (putative) gypsy type domain-containing protein n=1 Tax=Lolium multiflorum TaxID=4521 RepID=A0AAD8WCK2_LOLMU|nr:hypothetical protein QYE76_066932 [Lolium multiflorum]
MATEDLEWERSKISNQDMNLLKRLGFTKEKDALRFPHEESYPSPPMEYRVSFVDHLIRGLSPPIHEFLRGLLFVYGLQLHQLTPNSILHVSIFITLCECFLGVQPNWALWKRIFCLRRNGSHGVAYNIGGVVICVRSDVDYFDVKFPDSVQGWRKRWLYVHEESSDSMEYNIAPFDGKTKILRHRSWDAEASEEEILATEALMTRIRELQSTRGKELSGIQITAYFLRIRVQPLQARKNPLWTYAGDEDVERLSTDLSAKDLEKLIRRISKLSKKDTVPSSCKVKPFCSANPLPEKSAASLEKENDTEVTSSTRSSLPAASPKGKRKRDETIDSGASKADTSRAEKTAPDAGEKALDLYDAALISSDDEEEDAPIDETARTSTSRSFLDATTEDERVEARSNALLRLAHDHGSNFWGTPERTRQIVRLQDRALQVRDYLDFCTRTLSLVYGTMFPRNKMPETLPALMDKFRDAPRIHGFVRAQLAAGARFAMIMIKICYPKLDVGQVVPKCLAKMAKRRKNFSKYDDVVTPVAEDMMDELLRMDSEFFVKGSYAEHSTRAINNERLTIDNILGNP